MDRFLKATTSALGLTLALLTCPLHAAGHKGKEGLSNPNPNPAPHHAGPAPAISAAPKSSGGATHVGGASSSPVQSFARPSAPIHNGGSPAASYSAPVHQPAPSHSAPAIPQMKFGPAQPQLGSGNVRVNSLAPVKTQSVTSVPLQKSMSTPAASANVGAAPSTNKSGSLRGPIQIDMPKPTNNPKASKTGSTADAGQPARSAKTSTGITPADRVRVPTNIETKPSLDIRKQTKIPTTGAKLPDRTHVPVKDDVKTTLDVGKRTKLPTADEAATKNALSAPTLLEKSNVGHPGTLPIRKLPAQVDRPNDNRNQQLGREKARHLPTTTDRLKSGHLDHLVNNRIARQIDLKKQFQLHEHGDRARRMKLSNQLAHHGGWKNRLAGPISPLYTKHAFSHCYAGPGFYPHFCWYPHWSPWVNWCWNFSVVSLYDPRPIFCQPIVYQPCQTWVGWDYPDWTTLPVVASGTWVDAPIVSIPSGVDVQLLAVRFVDPGHPDKAMGPKYRIWVRNNSAIAVDQPFDLVIYGSNSQLPGMGLPEAGVRVTGMGAGQVQAIDLRVPFEANTLDRDAQGRRVPFRHLHVIVDSQRELADVDPNNNGAVLDRLEVLPVDPTIFSAALDDAAGGLVVDVAGEGLGPEAGQVVVQIGERELTPEILGWCDVGVQVRLPNLTLSDTLKAELVVIRGDRAASNPLPITIPAAGVAEVVPNPVP